MFNFENIKTPISEKENKENKEKLSAVGEERLVKELEDCDVSKAKEVAHDLLNEDELE